MTRFHGCLVAVRKSRRKGGGLPCMYPSTQKQQQHQQRVRDRNNTTDTSSTSSIRCCCCFCCLLLLLLLLLLLRLLHCCCRSLLRLPAVCCCCCCCCSWSPHLAGTHLDTIAVNCSAFERTHCCEPLRFRLLLIRRRAQELKAQS